MVAQGLQLGMFQVWLVTEHVQLGSLLSSYHIDVLHMDIPRAKLFSSIEVLHFFH